MLRHAFLFAFGCFMGILLFWVASVTQALGQDYDMDYYDPVAMQGACHKEENLDKWELKLNPDNSGEYLFEYSNNKAQCSHNIDGIAVEAEDGFRVILHVKTGVNENEDELIWVIPEDTQYMPYPAEIWAPDSSESYKIRLIPGMV